MRATWSSNRLRRCATSWPSSRRRCSAPAAKARCRLPRLPDTPQRRARFAYSEILGSASAKHGHGPLQRRHDGTPV
ncbi:hypothetical protein CBM2609_A70201 [Cupriavidus taiwanensis]|nr:hypothetical protein CBM2604_A60199 [Cupriavidus taiwanensis]SOZ28908.1 hypothetical protein CBM2609_A70201 [Cupriavidus taiwanensis]SOZ50056.1 hypothetical protein CBM2615_A130031 [Cupriavidus taiwanensis]SOZ50533.1 hypothetical protein CBM2614_A130031 [Cupriavidus taiwanensis]SPA04033.1 hypothetical protein CBM2625_A100031 [Cupriavidus taiwanensis]